VPLIEDVVEVHRMRAAAPIFLDRLNNIIDSIESRILLKRTSFER
jgi:hypothetical protein